MIKNWLGKIFVQFMFWLEMKDRQKTDEKT